MIQRFIGVCLFFLLFSTTALAGEFALIRTSLGDIKVELNREKAPLSVANFVAYAEQGFYQDTIFHRVIKDFMVQGGGFTAGMKRKETLPPIKNEAANGLKNLRGTIAMARTNVIDSATSQFFINHKDNDFLDHKGVSPATYGYAVFGQVVQGMEVVDAIAAKKTGGNGMFKDMPVEPVIIRDVQVLQEGQ
ncbi:MAG: peptidylprolyl isomerase [Trichloromonas sp.]|jgi:cyclophilin family peptidyl-prolyl cis-trans isomerase|nr:peptidylprolyl isomerase [Trichloromonas sp.]